MPAVISNERLSELAIPGADGPWNDFVGEHCDGSLGLARALVDQLKDGTPRDAETTLDLWNQVNIALDQAFAVVSLFEQVHPSEDVRTLCEAREQEAEKLSTDIGLDRDLYATLAGVDGSGLDAGATRVLERSLRDFRRSGVDKDDETRSRIRDLAERETQVAQEFSKNIRDDVRSVRLDPSRLVGLPQDFIDAHPAGDDGLVEITTDYPDVVPFRTFAVDADARRALTIEFLNRAWPANDALLEELLALRAEHARLLGYESWPDYDAEVKMVGSGAAIADFIDRIASSAQSSAERDYAVLLERMQLDRPTATAIDGADASYYAELIRRENFDVDAQDVRRYFDFPRVRAGLLDVTGRLFGLAYVPVDGPPTWHPDVTAYDVMADGQRLGRIYLDLHPREGKFKHAAQFTLASGIAGKQLPEGVLACNVPRGLMQHSDVVTLFHEFGHLLHHVLAGRHRWARFAGVATEWDFVEAPSQMLEEWAWDLDVLQSFAANADGAPIPAGLVAKMRAGKEFGKGYLARTQMFYAAISYVLHREPVDDLTELVKTLQATFDVFPYIEGTHFHAAFGHLEGYTSAYYTYMWSLVIAKDLFSAFDPESLLDTTTSYRYRDTVLIPGGSMDAADLVEAFLGRPYNVEAFTSWLSRPPGEPGGP